MKQVTNANCDLPKVDKAMDEYDASPQPVDIPEICGGCNGTLSYGWCPDCEWSLLFEDEDL
jgi:hypothetical protein